MELEIGGTFRCMLCGKPDVRQARKAHPSFGIAVKRTISPAVRVGRPESGMTIPPPWIAISSWKVGKSVRSQIDGDGSQSHGSPQISTSGTGGPVVVVGGAVVVAGGALVVGGTVVVVVGGRVVVGSGKVVSHAILVQAETPNVLNALTR